MAVQIGFLGCDSTRRTTPAGEVAVLYHERREIETAYFELKSTIPGGRVLRARTPDGIEQEIYALLVTYQALRTAIADAAATVPGTDPDRASFAIALNTARDQVILAAGVTAGPVTDLAGTTGRLVLASLMPSRRPARQSPRRQTRHVQVQRQRQGRPHHLQGHHHHHHPHRPLDTR